ncbi:MAG: hypothetical protein BWY75_00860 [bacterium ADurb.Bin425]|nr:MAG: hypothetical protein BWY75_00860 [bacterium ADurb.Bin425]
MQTITPTASLHHTTGKFVYDSDFGLALFVGNYDIVGVELVDFFCSQRLCQVMGIVMMHVKKIVDAEHFLCIDYASFCQQNVALFFIDIIVAVFVVFVFAPLKQGRNLRHANIKLDERLAGITRNN